MAASPAAAPAAPRLPRTCRKCRVHEVRALVSGHVCKFERCVCEGCARVEETRRKMRKSAARPEPQHPRGGGDGARGPAQAQAQGPGDDLVLVPVVTLNDGEQQQQQPAAAAEYVLTRRARPAGIGRARPAFPPLPPGTPGQRERERELGACRTCHRHGASVPMSGHHRFNCPYRRCSCSTWCVVRRRKRLEVKRRRRSQARAEARAPAPGQTGPQQPPAPAPTAGPAGATELLYNPGHSSWGDEVDREVAPADSTLCDAGGQVAEVASPWSPDPAGAGPAGPPPPPPLPPPPAADGRLAAERWWLEGRNAPQPSDHCDEPVNGEAPQEWGSVVDMKPADVESIVVAVDPVDIKVEVTASICADDPCRTEAETPSADAAVASGGDQPGPPSRLGCPSCGADFQADDDLQDHVDEVHMGLVPLRRLRELAIAMEDACAPPSAARGAPKGAAVGRAQ
ncbi:hypothetical protein ONE63_000439 [Megalurothrips usitatus]|uniref:C2H2-type domain-containing protein n=1 Tax=Megalurothrips usitatus TaxID=439358 RepID=A0AAV7Y1H9_9NEOP|nr:hypothetical protein ONE63_000439 [Megalurothrips usitatus]